MSKKKQGRQKKKVTVKPLIEKDFEPTNEKNSTVEPTISKIETVEPVVSELEQSRNDLKQAVNDCIEAFNSHIKVCIKNNHKPTRYVGQRNKLQSLITRRVL